ncbi:MAG: hypothetical protein EZS26_000231 [Candidatus Ordinivivax streblomastigis]|uniref:Uncharacterized protein n=1 Tax=Candidatus Ordinivivax streblomastigis TaxID=2540710 RepID=A0A5M8P641_9BACT|nr:MAG: hypothetical protein EZS26_000231 [Candidatus Ordinivivax streblomastigis]
MVILGILLTQHSSGGEAFFIGAIQGLVVLLIIWIISLYKKKKE